jgi:hypothetical protein
MKPFLRQHGAFLAVLLGAATLRLALLIVSQCWADGDESLIGVMALHILHRGDRPIYFWGQPYNGGGAVGSLPRGIGVHGLRRVVGRAEARPSGFLR